ncbi:hypothetical protein [Paenibacillus guangzhouensis]|nr:hypothetical protein [Paenibacillus guangzhouensis]
MLFLLSSDWNSEKNFDLNQDEAIHIEDLAIAASDLVEVSR